MIVKEQTQRGRRNVELLNETPTIPKTDISAICYYLMDLDFNNGKMRTNRPLPTDPKEKAYAMQLNESDGEWLEKLQAYRKDLELKANDLIPLTEFQASWIDYILGKSDMKPINENPVEAMLRDVSSELADVPF